MIRSGDLFTPTINGAHYPDKPLLGYWLIVAVAWLKGGVVDEWCVRLPSVAAALVALAATRSLGRRLAGAGVAEAASWMLLASWGFMNWARMGQSDMGDVAVIVGAVAWYWKCRERLGLLTLSVFYLIIGVGAHLKGLAALALPVMLVAVDLVTRRRWRQVISVHHGAALLVGIGVFFAPFLLCWVAIGQARAPLSDAHELFDAMIRENILRYVHPFDHREPVSTYFCYLPVLMSPWVSLLIASAAQWLRPTVWREMSPECRWLAMACIVIFAFFTASGSRRSYYILPLLPFVALWTAVYVNRLLPRADRVQIRWAMRGQGAFLLLLALLEIIVGAALPRIADWYGTPTSAPIQVSFAALGLSVPFCLCVGEMPKRFLARITRIRPELVPQIAASVLLIVGYFCVQHPLIDLEYGSARSFARSIAAERNAGAQVVFYRQSSDRLVFYLDSPKPIDVLDGPGSVLERAAQVPRLVVLGRRDNLEQLQSEMPAAIQAERLRNPRFSTDRADDRDSFALVLREEAEPTFARGPKQLRKQSVGM